MKRKKYIFGFIMLVFILGACGKSSKDVGSSAAKSETNKEINNALVGNWKTDCLIPKPSDQWAELHSFIFADDGTATHNRKAFFKAGCDGTADMDDTNRYSYGVEDGGKIMFMDLDQGVPLYDIYAVEGNTLRFGHGFRNDAVFGGSGSIPEDRIKILNNFILYKKQ
ncbi:hypothetical protein HYW83_06370 [Candidatus Peregrinibacteria bacterium]|nr:hypothetical protein [Candidatus Peregrinibacteria bacterium]